MQLIVLQGFKMASGLKRALPAWQKGKWFDMLPGHYKKRFWEAQTRQPIPVHWIPYPEKYMKHPKTGEK